MSYYTSMNGNPSFGGGSANGNNHNIITATMSANAESRLVYGKDDALFGSIERQQQQHHNSNNTNNNHHSSSFGAILDAGTGLHSLRWLATLLQTNRATRCVAVTADETMQRNCQREVDALGVSHATEILMGNWFEEETNTANNGNSGNGNYSLLQQLKPGSFDVILADYLIGAMDGFSPYRQDEMIPKLARLLTPGTGRLYLVGLQPLPDAVPHDPAASLICRVRQVRDACILLAGHRCYREYPVDWIQRQVRGHSSLLTLQHTSTFPILYKQETIVKQINVARSKFHLFPTPGLVTSMGVILDELESNCWDATQRSGTGRIQLGFDYIVTAQRKGEDDDDDDEEDDDDDDDDEEDDDEDDDDESD